MKRALVSLSFVPCSTLLSRLTRRQNECISRILPFSPGKINTTAVFSVKKEKRRKTGGGKSGGHDAFSSRLLKKRWKENERVAIWEKIYREKKDTNLSSLIELEFSRHTCLASQRNVPHAYQEGKESTCKRISWVVSLSHRRGGQKFLLLGSSSSSPRFGGSRFN